MFSSSLFCRLLITHHESIWLKTRPAFHYSWSSLKHFGHFGKGGHYFRNIRWEISTDIFFEYMLLFFLQWKKWQRFISALDPVQTPYLSCAVPNTFSLLSRIKQQALPFPGILACLIEICRKKLIWTPYNCQKLRTTWFGTWEVRRLNWALLFFSTCLENHFTVFAAALQSLYVLRGNIYSRCISLFLPDSTSTDFFVVRRHFCP